MQQVDYSRKWWVMASVAMGVFLATIDGSIVNIALPNLVNDLKQPLAVVQWVVLAYLLTLTTLMLSVGRLADMIGRKRLYLAGMFIFTTGSLLCGISPNVYWLIGFRVFQAIGAAMTQALGTAIVTDAFPAEERGKAMGIIGGIVSIGIIAGPTLGGLILGVLSWHWLFFVNLPVGIIGFIISSKFIPADHAGSNQHFDFSGAAAMFLSLMSLLLALTFGESSTFTSPLVLILFALFAIGLFVFIKIEQHSQEPMIDLALFKSKVLSTNLITGFLTFIGTAGTVLLIPFYLQNMRGFTPEKAGLMMSIIPLTSGIVSPLAGSLSDRFGSKLITTLGLAFEVVGFLLIAGLTVDTSIAGFLLRFAPLGLGLGLFQAPNNSAIMGSAQRSQLGVVSGLLSLTRTLGQTTGIAILGAIWTSQVVHLTGFLPQGGATAAPLENQIAGLQGTVLIVVVIVVVSLMISAWTLLPSRKSPSRSASDSQF